MEANCIWCGKFVEDYNPRFCCNGIDCGCQGRPIDPPEHLECVIIEQLKSCKKMVENKMEGSFGAKFCKDKTEVELELFLGTQEFKTKDISLDIAHRILDNISMLTAIDSYYDVLVKLLEEHRDKNIREEK